jgi:hypothetical protein
MMNATLDVRVRSVHHERYGVNPDIYTAQPFRQRVKEQLMTHITHYWGEHQFAVHRHEVAWNDVPGIYVFAVPNGLSGWAPLYIGQASSLKDRLSNHERWDEAARRGAAHIHARVVTSAADRDRVERDLIQKYQPPMNTQLKSLASLAGSFGGLTPPSSPNSDFMKSIRELGLLGAAMSQPQRPNALRDLMYIGLPDSSASKK